MNKLDKIIRSNLCNGCGGCAALAPDHIKMQETETEARRPKICGPLNKKLDELLVEHCPGANADLPATPASDITSAAWGPILEIWEGYASDTDIRFKGSSGGAVTALALHSIEQAGFSGALHVKADTDNPILNKASISRNKTDLMVGSGSRYAPASVCDELHTIENQANKTTVIGKPCDIAGTEKIAASNAQIKEKIGLTISIFCAGSPSHHGTQQLLNKLGAKQNNTLQSLDYRGEGWPGNMRARWQTPEGDTYSHETSYADGWGNILQKHRQWRCHTCADHTGEWADISVGDPWQNPPAAEEHGKSLIVVRTERGRRMLRAAMKAGYIIAKPQKPSVLFAAQPNLFATKGAVWGRSVALVLSGLKAPTFTRASFQCWVKLPTKAKMQSILGTFKRILSKKLYQSSRPQFLNGNEG